MNYSYSFQNTVRDLSDLIDEVIRIQPVFLSLVRIGAPATNVKHEWLQDVLAATQDATAASALAAATSLSVVDGTKFAVNDIWVNVSTDERFKVTAIATNTLTIVRAVGGTDTAMASGEVLKLVARPKLQGTDPGDDKGQEPTVEFNHTQIFDRTAKVARTAQYVNTYGIDDQLDYQVKVQVDQLVREMNMSALYGERQAPAASTPGMMRGLVTFLEKATSANAVNGAGAALTKTMLNDAIEAAFNDGAGELALLCGPNQARKITALDSNYQIVRGDTTSGKVIMQYMGDIAGNAAASKIVVDPNYPKKRIDLVDLSRVALVPLQNSALRDMDATPPGADYFARRILGEYTFEVKNAADAHASVYNLAA